MATLTRAQAQQLESTTELRIKFAGMNRRGDLIGDAHDEYPKFFGEQLPSGWSAAKLGEIETRTEAKRDAWHLTNGQIDLVAVQHETGVEILLVGVATNLISAGLIAFAAWGWRRWRDLRKNPPHPKVDPSLVIEVPRKESAGRALPPLRLIIPQPVSDADINRYVAAAMRLGEST